MNKIVHLQTSEDHRQYKRLKAAMPIKFSIVRLQGNLPGLGWENAKTHNVSKGGLCLETESLSPTIIKFLHDHNIFLDLEIFIPFASQPIKAVCDMAWYKTDATTGHCMIGVKFRSIAPENVKKILKHVERSKWVLPVVIALATITLITIIFSIKS